MKKGNKFKLMKIQILLPVLTVLLLGLLVVSLNLGTLAISPGDVFKTLFGQGTSQQELTLFTIRMPRIVIGLFVGAALAVSGIILQSVTGNDLAEPGTLGISSGAALFVVVYIYLTNGNNYYSMPKATIYTMPVIALCGGMLAAFLVYALAWKKGLKPTKLLLMGIAVNAGFSSLIIIMQLTFQNKDFNRVLMWTSGSLWGTSWSYVIAVCPVLTLLCVFAYYRSRYLDVFTLGDEMATGLGVRVERERRILLVLSVALAAVATSVAGSISFVGLMAPHIARRLVGPKHRLLTPVAIVLGMILITGADMIARNMFAPVELHIGTVISMIGVPYFIYLMLKQ